MRAHNLVQEMTETVFKGVETKPMGSCYTSLCSAFPLVEIKTNAQHKVAIEVIGRIIDFLNSPHEGIEVLVPEIESYLSTLSALVEKYEKELFPKAGKAKASDVLSYLMESHQLNQDDLADELGGQSVVSSILHGKRELNLRQIRALAKKFKLSPGAFISS
jgi:HTH-type transcriptional regulator/antitoxin HigA